jgi:hypothetical protein
MGPNTIFDIATVAAFVVLLGLVYRARPPRTPTEGLLTFAIALLGAWFIATITRFIH